MKQYKDRVLAIALLLCLLPGFGAPAESVGNATEILTEASPEAATETSETAEPAAEATQEAASETYTGSLGPLLLVPDGATAMTVEWNGPENGSYEISWHVTGQERTVTHQLPINEAYIYSLAPNTEYEVTVTNTANGDSATETFTTDNPEAYREYGYRWSRCNPYLVMKGTESLYDRSKNRIVEVSAQNFQKQRENRELFVILEASFNQSSETKAWNAVWVMRTPGGDVFASMSEYELAPDWQDYFAAYPVEAMIDDYLLSTGDVMEKGTYRFELYFDGLFAGRTSFRLN